MIKILQIEHANPKTSQNVTLHHTTPLNSNFTPCYTILHNAIHFLKFQQLKGILSVFFSVFDQFNV